MESEGTPKIEGEQESDEESSEEPAVAAPEQQKKQTRNNSCARWCPERLVLIVEVVEEYQRR